MPELVATRASIVACCAEPAALDELIRTEVAHACRIAPDEVMLVGEASNADALVRAAAARAGAGDPDAVVLDVTDGWAVWTLEGDGTREAFARLSELEPVAGVFTQGDVAHVPVRVIALPDRLHLLVPVIWREHLRERILASGARERPGDEEWS